MSFFDGRRSDPNQPAHSVETICRGRRACLHLIAASVLIGTLFQTEFSLAGEWADTRRIGRIVVASEVRIDRFVGIVNIIQQHESDVLATLDLSATQAPIEIYILASRKSYAEFVGRQAPEAINRRAAFAKNEDGIGRVFIYVQDDFEIDLRHELTHAVLHASLPFVPLWLDEGIAEYFEVRTEDRPSKNPHQARLKWSLRLFWKPNLERLERKSALIEMNQDDYRESWAWVHYLLHGPADVQSVLPEYLRSIQSGEPPGPLSKTLSAKDPNASRRLVSHFKSWK